MDIALRRGYCPHYGLPASMALSMVTGQADHPTGVLLSGLGQPLEQPTDQHAVWSSQTNPSALCATTENGSAVSKHGVPVITFAVFALLLFHCV